jgi:hypothetical protein
MKKFIFLFAGAIMEILGLILSCVIRFTNISETETQLFLYHWQEWVIVVALILVGYLAIYISMLTKE